MTVLPILQRELRRRARSRANYWTRFGVGLAGALIGLPALAWSGGLGSLGIKISPASVGQGVFDGIVGGAFVLCCAACLVTADSISAERREGTLGLLLLTRVKRFDVLLGKFASNGLTYLCELLAFMPVLMVPVLVGGVTGGEVTRKALALLDALFLALSAGLCASARGQERFKTARSAALILGGLVLVPSFLGWLLPATHLELASPLGALVHAADLPYKASPQPYWLSLGFVQAVGWGLLLTAVVNLRAGLRSDDYGVRTTPRLAGSSRRRSATLPAAGAQEHIAAFTPGVSPEDVVSSTISPKRSRWPGGSSSEVAPLHWLLSRQRGMKWIVWSAAAVSLLQYTFYWLLRIFIGLPSPAMSLGAFYALNLVTSGLSGALLAWAASRFFIEARRSGELELLMTTPVGAQSIVFAQWDLLKRLLRGPLVLMVLPGLLQVFLTMMALRRISAYSGLSYYYAIMLVLGPVNIVLAVAALCWLGLWFGLRTDGQARAILWTVGLARGVPYALGLACSLLSNLLVPGFLRPGSAARWIVASLGPQLVNVVLYVSFIYLARRQVLHQLSGAQPLTVRQVFSAVLARGATTIRQARHWTPR